MIIPNYVPLPDEVVGNVAQAPYLARLGFIKRVSLRHLLSIWLLVPFTVGINWPSVGLLYAVVTLAMGLIALDLWRIAVRGRAIEAKVTEVLLIPLLGLVAWTLNQATDLGWPVWPLLVGPTCSFIYTLLCGRDYSFVGNYFLSLIGSTLITALILRQLHLDPVHRTWSLSINALYLSYFIYDLASLQARRRVNEEFAAVVDLYRDIFNFPGYLLRVMKHWQRHQIWQLPKNQNTISESNQLP